MTTNESKAQNPESSVQIRLWDAEISICSNANGDIEVSGERNDVVGIVTHYIHEKLLVRGRTRSDALRVAREITKEFDAEMVNFEGVRRDIRNAWIELLKANLVGEAAQCYGQRMHEFQTWRGLAVMVKAGSHHVLHCGGPLSMACFDLSDGERIIVQRSNKKPWSARWEDVTQISFSYFEPPPESVRRLRGQRLSRNDRAVGDASLLTSMIQVDEE